jgi:capsular polysaccharide biosynthesis protein
VPLAAYFTYVRRHAVLLLVTTILGAMAGTVLGDRLTAYVGTAAVLVPPANLDPQGVPNSNLVPTSDKDALTPDTEAQIATSSVVLEQIRKATGLTAPVETLGERLVIDAPTNTRVLTLSFEARKPANARKGAQIAADAYLAARKQLLADRQASDLAALEAQISALRREYAGASAASTSGAASARATAALRAGTLETKVRSLRRSATRMRTTPVDAGSVLRPAAESGLRARTSPEIPLTSGLLGGLLLGLLLTRIAPRRRVATTTSARAVDPTVDVLALPRARRRGVGQWMRRPIMRRRASRPGPAVRRLRNHVVADGGGVTVLCGPVRPAAVAALTMGLARLLSRLGEPVALVLDDNPKTLRSLRIRPEELRTSTSPTPPDSTHPLAAESEQQPIPDVLAGVTVHRLPSGPDAATVVATLAASYRHVIVALPGTPDAAQCTVARAADRVLLCTERRRSRVRDLRAVVRRLRLVKARITLGLMIGADHSRLWRETGDLL